MSYSVFLFALFAVNYFYDLKAVSTQYAIRAFSSDAYLVSAGLHARGNLGRQYCLWTASLLREGTVIDGNEGRDQEEQ